MVKEISPQYTRRQFLWLVSVAFAATIIGKTEPGEAGEDRDEIIERIEEKFEVLIAQINDFPGENSDENPAWNTEQLMLLEASLEVLPAHFYKPELVEMPRMIVLGRGRGSTWGKFSHWQREGYVTIEIAHEMFNPEAPLFARGVLTHELIHGITPETERIEEYTYNGQPAKRLVSESPWYDTIEQAIGEDYEIFGIDLLEEVSPKVTMYVRNESGVWIPNPEFPQDLPIDEWEQERFYVSLAAGARNINEFVAYLGMYYMYGKETFFKYYGEFLDLAVVEGLYAFVKEDIYKGTEYLP